MTFIYLNYTIIDNKNEYIKKNKQTNKTKRRRKKKICLGTHVLNEINR